MRPIEHARRMYKRGFHVIPLNENSKTPRLPKGHPYLRRRATREEVARFDWSGNPNYGIVTGKTGGVVVMDVDIHTAGSNGIETLANLGFDTSPLTPTVKTPSGGYHFYYAYRGGIKTTHDRVGPGIDVRSDGGYVVGPGSVIDGKVYEWTIDIDEYPMEEPPAFLYGYRDDPERNQSPSLARPFTEGSRNNMMFSLACSLVKRNVPPWVIEDMLLTYFNPRWCKPPLEKEEVRRLCASAERYRKQDHGEEWFLRLP